MSTIYWKFKNTKSEFSSITFDSTHVSILDLKRAIIKQKQLQQTPQRPFDLSIINAHTGVEYTDETGPIPRNLAVIVRRLPAARNQHKKLWAPLQNNSVIATADNISKKQMITISERLNNEFGPALFNDSNHNASHLQTMSNSNANSNASNNKVSSAEVNAVETETMNIIDMMNRRMNNGTSHTNASNSGGMRNNHHMNRMNNRHTNGSNQHNKDQKQSYRSQRGDPPPGYICHRCHVSGHWIQDCPTNGDPKFDKKNRSQSLRSHQLPVPKPATPTNISGDNSTTNIPTQQVIVGQKCYQIPTNVYESFNGDHSKIKAYIEISSGTTNFSQQSTSQVNGHHSRYKCEICDNYYVDARFTPCCRVTYCNECIRQKSLAQNPSMIKCPSCEEIFSSEALDTAQNTKLQEKVNKMVAQQAKHAANSNNIVSTASITVTANKTESNAVTVNTVHAPKPIITSTAHKTIQIQPPHTIHISQPQIIPKIRPTVILQQSPPNANVLRITPIMPPVAPAPRIMAIDTTRYEAPKSTLSSGSNLNYVCIECNERGHKYKDCPKVAEKQLNANSNQPSKPKITNQSVSIKDENMDSIKSLKDEGLNRIPKKTINELEKNNNNNNNIVNNNNNNNTNNNNNNNNNNMCSNKKTIGFINAPQVQLINNSAINTLNAINNANNINMMNMRNRMTVNNILMNAALHNASRRARAGGIAPRIINSHSNSLLNPSIALSRMSSTRNNALALFQQQSLLNQQAAALNRLRSNNYQATINHSIHNIAATHNNNINNNNKKSHIGNIPQHILDSTINELKQVMSSQDTAAVTNAINAAFIKLGAVDPESKRLVLEQLVKTCSSSAKQQQLQPQSQTMHLQSKPREKETLQLSQNKNDLDSNKKLKKKHKKSKGKRSKKRKHKDKSSKDRKHRHSKRKRERERGRIRSKSKSRSRSRDRKSKHDVTDSDNEYNSNVTDFPDPELTEVPTELDEDENNVIHINIQPVNDKKRVLPPAPIPDFNVSPTNSPKHKKQKIAPK